jgi:hypothetical protein
LLEEPEYQHRKAQERVEATAKIVLGPLLWAGEFDQMEGAEASASCFNCSNDLVKAGVALAEVVCTSFQRDAPITPAAFFSGGEPKGNRQWQ